MSFALASHSHLETLNRNLAPRSDVRSVSGAVSASEEGIPQNGADFHFRNSPHPLTGSSGGGAISGRQGDARLGEGEQVGEMLQLRIPCRTSHRMRAYHLQL